MTGVGAGADARMGFRVRLSDLFFLITVGDSRGTGMGLSVRVSDVIEAPVGKGIAYNWFFRVVSSRRESDSGANADGTYSFWFGFCDDKHTF
jgi:hypothetical protein